MAEKKPRMTLFRHKGENYFSCIGYIITCREFAAHSANKLERKEIFETFGISYQDLKDDIDMDYERARRHYPPIKSLQEHYDYILTGFIISEESAKIKKKMKECKTHKQIIDLFPGPFRLALMIHLRVKMLQKMEKEAESKSLERTKEI